MKRMIERKLLRLAARTARPDLNAERDAHFGALAEQHLASPDIAAPDEELPEPRESYDPDSGFSRLTRGAR